MPYYVKFIERESGPEKLVCEAEIHFTEGPLSGMKLVGISLWQGPDGDVYVTMPSRAFGAGYDRKYFDYLREGDGAVPGTNKRTKSWILAEWKEQQCGFGTPNPRPTVTEPIPSGGTCLYCKRLSGKAKTCGSTECLAAHRRNTKPKPEPKPEPDTTTKLDF